MSGPIEHVAVGSGSRVDAALPGRRTSWSQTAYFLTLLVLLPTLMLFALNRVIGLLGASINIDFMILYAASVFVARARPSLGVALATAGTATILAVQLAMGLGLIYIENLALIPEYLRFLPTWPWKVIGVWAALGLAALIVLYVLLKRRPLGQAKIMPAVLLLVLVLGLDLLGRTAVGYDLLKANLATSSALRATKLAIKWSQPPGLQVSAFPGNTMQADVRALPVLPDRILSIAVESFGAAHDRAFNAKVTAPLIRNVSAAYVVENGVHAYHGATLAGEIRELCGLRISGTPTAAEAAAMNESCLPAQLRRKGYATLGLHGNSRFFYNRGELYPTIGFDKALFYNDLLAERRGVCKTRAFAGICDRDAIQAALDFGRDHPRSFAHVMTLDSHFPLGSRAPGDRVCPPGAEPPSAELCLYENQLAGVMGTIGATLAAAQVKPDLVYIYGDHAPPYAIASDRAFFDRVNVPFIVLRRRGAGDAP